MATARITELSQLLPDWGKALGFADIGISQADTSQATPRLREWLKAGRQGEMGFMAEHVALRENPSLLVPGTVSVISATLPYWPDSALTANAQAILQNPDKAYVSRYTLGRDYHKVFRMKLQKLASQIESHIGAFGYRVFSDSAPVLEVEFATQARLGWRGKHSLLLNRTGSWFFLGEIYTDLPLLPTPSATSIPSEQHCGTCVRCLSSCPTQAIIAPYQVDARRCISYLTIEHPGSIPVELRPLMGNRIYGCDDCQLVCPWNHFTPTGDPAFAPRLQLDDVTLTSLFAWNEVEFEARLSGNAIRRIGHERWLRNLSVALGNALRKRTNPAARNSILEALQNRKQAASPLIQEHIDWALEQNQQSQSLPTTFTVQSQH
jgi:epoxyqueuosine reductase